jgi:hypothetical protein
MLMLKLAAGALGAGWIVLLLIGVTGHLSWDNKLLWAPPILFMCATSLGLCGLDDEDRRVPLLLVAALAFCSALGYGVFYFFLFGLVGR